MAGNEVKTTQGVAKTMLLFGLMYDSLFSEDTVIPEKNKEFVSKHDKNKFLSGTLFSLNGLLNIEAKSWLMTKEDLPLDKKEGFQLLAEVTNSENPIDEHQAKYIRTLSEDDSVFFENEFCQTLIWFVETVTQGHKGAIKNANL